MGKGYVISQDGSVWVELTKDEQSIRDAIRQKQAEKNAEKQAEKDAKKAALKVKGNASLADVVEVLSVVAEIESGRLE